MHKIVADNAAECLSCLYHQVEGFRKEIFDGNFHVRINKKDYNMETINCGLRASLPAGAVIHIIPAVEGSGKKVLGWVGVIAGIALIATGIFAPVSAVWASTMIGAGAALTGAGAALLLTRTPSFTADNNNDGETNNNTSFSSLDNGIAQGAAVPLIYGQIMIGSKIISQGLESL